MAEQTTKRFEVLVAGPNMRAHFREIEAPDATIAAAMAFRDVSGCEACEINDVQWTRDPATGGAVRVGGHGLVTTLG